MICEKCKKDFSDKKWEKGETYEGIDSHHNPPEFMLDKWKGNMIDLCRKHHREIHDFILDIMFKHSTLFKPLKSEHWMWVNIIPYKREECIEEVIKFTEEWLEDDTRYIKE